MFGIGDVLLENAKAIDFCRQLGRQSRAGDVAGFGDFARRAGGVRPILRRSSRPTRPTTSGAPTSRAGF